jgi:hypothetical protein
VPGFPEAQVLLALISFSNCLHIQSARHSAKPKRYVDEPDIEDETLDDADYPSSAAALPYANGPTSTFATPTTVVHTPTAPATHHAPSSVAIPNAAIEAATEDLDLENTRSAWGPLLESYQLSLRRRTLAFRQSLLSADKAASVKTAERIVTLAGERMVYLVDSITESERAAAEEEARQAELRKQHEMEQAVLENAMKDRKERKREAAIEGWKKRKMAKEEQEERRQERKRARLAAWESELRARGEDPANHIPPPVDGPGWHPSLDDDRQESSLGAEDEFDFSDSDRARRPSRKRKTADDLVIDAGYDPSVPPAGYPPYADGYPPSSDAYGAAGHYPAPPYPYYHPSDPHHHHHQIPYGAQPAGPGASPHPPTYQYDPATGRPIAYGRHLPYGVEPEGPPAGPAAEEGQALGRGARNPRSLAEKRQRAVEEAERRTWVQIAKTQIPKVRGAPCPCKFGFLLGV